MEKIKGYKVMNPDMTCRGFQYEVGKSYHHTGSVSLCDSGFHFCLTPSNCFNYYDFDSKNVVCEIEAWGNVVNGDDKSVCDNIMIVKKLEWNEVLSICNTGKDNTGNWNSGDGNSGDGNSGNGNSGNWNSGNRNIGKWNSGNWNSGDWNSGNGNSGNGNSGDWNSGNWNSGNWNSGNWNSGNWNSGDWNSGNWNSGNGNSGDWNSGNGNSGNGNSGNRNSGYFCTLTPNAIIFDIQTNMTHEEVCRTKWYKILFSKNFNLNNWVSFSEMTDKEKAANPNAYVCDGYLKTKSYKEAWKELIDSLTAEEIKIVKTIPNWNPDKFEQITGCRI